MWQWLVRLLTRRSAVPGKRPKAADPARETKDIGGKPATEIERPSESSSDADDEGEHNSDVEQDEGAGNQHDSDRQGKQPGGFLSVATDEPAKSRPVAEQRPLWLGVDYGTSMSKLVITDYGFVDGTRSFPVRLPDGEDGYGEYRIPSTLSLDSGTIHFGNQAEMRAHAAQAVYRSTKMLCAYPDDFYGDTDPLPSGLDARDLATLFVGHLIQTGAQAATPYAQRVGAEPSFGITLGVPMAQLDDNELHKVFVGMAREAFNLKDKVDLLASVSVENAIDALAVVRKDLAGTDPPEPRDWVRSEAEAALYWAHGSPEIPVGRYACIDVGAGTTSASWFHISGKRYGTDFVKDSLSFYGAACAPPGCDAVDEILADDLDLSRRAEARGKESEMLSQLSTASARAVNDVLGKIARVFGTASREAYEKEKRMSRWSGVGRVFFLGGGSKIAVVRDRLVEQRIEWLKPSPIADPGVPADLVEEDGGELREDPTFLLVAYGLSRRLADVPDTFGPSEVADFKPEFREKSRLSHEDAYDD